MGYRKLVFSVEVLSHDSDEVNFNHCDLEQIARLIQEGPCVGRWGLDSEKPMTGKEMADALYDFGSEPSFFDLTEDGVDLDP